MKANGGVVMVTFVNAFVSPEWAKASGPLWKEYEERTRGVADPAERARIGQEIAARMPKIPVTLAQVADHVEHVRRVAGVDHVGLGGDYDGNDAWPQGLEDVSGYPRLARRARAPRLERRGPRQAGEREHPARPAAGRGGRAAALEGAAGLDGHDRGAGRRREAVTGQPAAAVLARMGRPC